MRTKPLFGPVPARLTGARVSASRNRPRGAQLDLLGATGPRTVELADSTDAAAEWRRVMTSTNMSLPVARTEAALRAELWAGRLVPPAHEQERLLRALVANGDGCWLWPGRARKGRGRASIAVAGRRVDVDVHRAVFVLMVGPIAPGHLVSQICGEPRCARPEHLYLITPRQLFERGVAAGRIRPLCGWVDGHGPRRAA